MSTAETDWFGMAKTGVDIAGGIASLFGSGGDSAPKPNRPFAGRVMTPSYTLGGGQLTRLQSGSLDQTRALQGRLGTLRQQIAPGFGQLSQAIGQQFGNQRSQAVGNLRTNMAQRGVLGSSFADTALNQVESEFAQQEFAARAQAFQQEFNASLATIQSEMALNAQELGRELQELGLSLNYLSGVEQETDKQSKELAKIAAQKAYNNVYSDLQGGAPPAPQQPTNKKKRRSEGAY